MLSHLTTSTTAAKAIGTLSSLTALCGALLLGGCNSDKPATATAAAPAVTVTPSPVAAPVQAPAKSIEGLPGTVFYADDESAYLLRVGLRGNKKVPLGKNGMAINAAVSPDGRMLAYVDGDEESELKNLMLADADGSNPRTLRRQVGGLGIGPAWSPDGRKLLIGVSADGDVYTRPVVVQVSGGKVTALPKSVRDFIHHRWSGDGKELFFATGECDLKHAHADGTGLRAVPVLGSSDNGVNPGGLRACDVVSVNTDGSRIAVDLHVGEEPDGDIAGSDVADTIIDTATGRPHPLPVRGKVLAARYGPTGDLLVRSEHQGKRTLTLLSPADAVLAQVPEPASLKNLHLDDYTS